MNAITLITSTMALGVMAGISGTHFHQVNAMVEHGAPVTVPAAASDSQSPQPVYEVKPAASGLVLASTQTTESTPRSKSKASALGSLDERETALMEILREIRKDQKNIRSQVSETNRDMDELTFRVDSHSTQFRPLQAEAVRPRAQVVPDDAFGSARGTGQLLPPKQ